MWSMLLPTRCPICGAAGAAPCGACWRRLAPAPSFSPPPGLDGCRALLRYEGAGRVLLSRLKYRNARSTLAWLALGMARLAAGAPYDVVTWAPTTAARRRARGYDQAELLARAVARHLGVPARPLLRRATGPPQTGRTRVERLDPRRAPAFRPRVAAAMPRRVLLVDDVVTTGATLAAAATVLRRAGAESVAAVTAGCTPLKVPSGSADA